MYYTFVACFNKLYCIDCLVNNSKVKTEYINNNNNNNKFISSRQVQSVKQSEYKQRVLIIAYRRLPESYKLSMLATYDT